MPVALPAIAVAADVHYVAVVGEAVDQRACHHLASAQLYSNTYYGRLEG